MAESYTDTVRIPPSIDVLYLYLVWDTLVVTYYPSVHRWHVQMGLVGFTSYRLYREGALGWRLLETLSSRVLLLCLPL